MKQKHYKNALEPGHQWEKMEQYHLPQTTPNGISQIPNTMILFGTASLINCPRMDKISEIARAVQANSASSVGSSKSQPLPENFEPTEFTVICARGKAVYNSPGNTWFRSLVEQQCSQYANAPSKVAKSLVVTSIVETVRKASPVGGFVRKINGRWHEMAESVARERVGQT